MTQKKTDPRITRLRRALKAGDEEALDAFWEDVSENGAPLVRPDGDHSLVTFVWRGDEATRSVTLRAFMDTTGENENRMSRLEKTDLWYAAFRLPNDYHGAYKFEVCETDDPDVTREAPDPHNPKTFIEPADPDRPDFSADDVDSVLELPDAPHRPWVAYAGPSGSLKRFDFHSEILGNDRRTWIYRPPGAGVHRDGEPLLIVLDGRFFAHAVGTPHVVDYLFREGRIPALSAVFVDNPGETWEAGDAARREELTCRQPHADFLADELLPWLAEEHGIRSNPDQTILAGGSLGGLASAFAVLARPDAFRTALSLSGSFWWSPEGDEEWEWLAQAVPEFEPAVRRFHLSVGKMESAPRTYGYPGQVLANRHMRDVLRAAGFEVSYAEAMHGHDSMAWQRGFADGLAGLSTDSLT